MSTMEQKLGLFTYPLLVSPAPFCLVSLANFVRFPSLQLFGFPVHKCSVCPCKTKKGGGDGFVKF